MIPGGIVPWINEPTVPNSPESEHPGKLPTAGATESLLLAACLRACCACIPASSSNSGVVQQMEPHAPRFILHMAVIAVMYWILFNCIKQLQL